MFIQVLAIAFVIASFLPAFYAVLLARMKSIILWLGLQAVWIGMVTQEFTPPVGMVLGLNWTFLAAITLLASTSYLLGSIPSGVLLSRLLGWVDPRGGGSGNIGATNVTRLAGWKAGVMVFAADFAKGAVAAGAGLALSLQNTLSTQPGAQALPFLAGVCAICGHIWPRFLHFRGGKGVATAAGACCVLMPGPTVLAAGIWWIARKLTGYASVASLAGTLALIPSAYALHGPLPAGFAGLLATLIVYTHRSNWVRLWTKTELSSHSAGSPRQNSHLS